MKPVANCQIDIIEYQHKKFNRLRNCDSWSPSRSELDTSQLPPQNRIGVFDGFSEVHPKVKMLPFNGHTYQLPPQNRIGVFDGFSEVHPKVKMLPFDGHQPSSTACAHKRKPNDGLMMRKSVADAISEAPLTTGKSNFFATQHLRTEIHQVITNDEPSQKKTKWCQNIEAPSNSWSVKMESDVVPNSSGRSCRSSWEQTEPLDLRINSPQVKICKSPENNESQYSSNISAEEYKSNDSGQQEIENYRFLEILRQFSEVHRENCKSLESTVESKSTTINSSPMSPRKVAECQKENVNPNNQNEDNININEINRKLYEECKKILNRLPSTAENLDPSILNNLEEKILEVSIYKPNMVRKFPPKERTPEEQERRRKNTEACRISRRKKKLENLAREEQIIAVRQDYRDMMQTMLELLSRVKNLKTLVRNEIEK